MASSSHAHGDPSGNIIHVLFLLSHPSFLDEDVFPLTADARVTGQLCLARDGRVIKSPAIYLIPEST
jgi:hypothetical protein